MRKFIIEFPAVGKQVTCTLLEDEPEVANGFWDWMATPQKCYTHPTISTGDMFSAWPRPPREEPQNLGDQTTPLSKYAPMLCTGTKRTESQDGDILWSGSFPCVIYGYITEPLQAGSAKIGKVDPECMDDLKIGGKDVWYHTVFYHTIGIVNFRRKED